jgi:hypothetical protein
MELYCTPKVNTLQLNTVVNSWNTRTRPTRTVPRNTHSYRILPTGPPLAIFQHSLPFLQSESFQTHVGTIHRRAIGPLTHHSGTLAYTSLTRHLPAPTIECLHRPRYKLACFSHAISRYELSLPTKSSPQPNTHVYTRTISRPDSQACLSLNNSQTSLSSLYQISPYVWHRHFHSNVSVYIVVLKRLFTLLCWNVFPLLSASIVA